MTAIGYVTHDTETGAYSGVLRTLSLEAAIEIVPNPAKTKETQPDFRIVAADKGVEIGAGWTRTGKISGRDYVSLSFAAPELGARRLYANLGVAADQDDDSVYAIIWNPDATP